MLRKNTKAPAETLNKEDVIQAVVIVDSFEGAFHPITSSIPEALIPIVNTPVLDYTLECLALSSVQEVILFCSSHADLIKEHIKQSKWNRLPSPMTVTVMVSETCRSLGDVMRDLDAKAVIRSDFILMTGDMVANLNLLHILEYHRKLQKHDKGAVMTMVYKDAGREHFSFEDETILAVNSSTGRILAHHKLIKTESKRIDISLETYVDHSRVELLYNLLDTQVAICTPAVPPLFSDNFDFQTRDDFVRGLLMNEEILASTIYWYKLTENQYAAHVSDWQKYQIVSHDIIYRWVYPFVPDSPFHWEQEPYMFLRHNVYKQKSVKLGKGSLLTADTVVGENTSVGDNTEIGQTVIGKNCHIGNNVKIYRSYIWDNVVIGDNCQINRAVIGHKSELGANVGLKKGCVLGPGVVLPKNTDLERTVLAASPVLSRNCLDQDEEYKLQKVAEKAYALHIDQSDSDSEEERRVPYLHDYLQKLPEEDSGSESEEELSASSEISERPPAPDDTFLFFTEVMDSLKRGYEDKLHPDNLILEINSSRYAYNVSMREVNYFVMKALLTLPIQAHLVDTAQKYIVEFTKLLQDFLPILQNYVRNSDAQEDCLKALEDEANQTVIIREGLLKLLHFLYEEDILGEENIMKWYNSGKGPTAMAVTVRHQVAPFIKWLEEADEESDDGDSS